MDVSFVPRAVLILCN
jgi:hypothetical protein